MTDFLNYIGGAWVAGPNTIENVNPSDLSDLIGQFASADGAQTDEAIDAAYSAFSSWRYSSIQQRFDVLDKIGSEILARKDELGTMLAREEGKTLAEAIGEVQRAGQIFKFFAGEALRIRGDSLASVRSDITVQVERESVGVVGIITPWNFPIAIPAWKIAPALAFGNTVVFKPAGLVPASAWNLADIISRSGLPDGVFNMLIGTGSTVGNAILTNPKVKAVSFTGSTDIGSRVAQICSDRGAKFQLEMGGKNPLIVSSSADIDLAVECAINGAFFSTGQRCTASSKLIVDSSVLPQFTDGMLSRLSELNVGNALAPDTHIGPVVSPEQLRQNLDYIEIGKAEGATLAFGGEALSLQRQGYYMSPALFVETSSEMRINQEEMFGPIATIIQANGFDHALELANQTQYGLCAGLCTTALSEAKRFQKMSQAGMTMINLPTAGVDYHVPFGGIKDSSYGQREQGSYAIDFYTNIKTTYLNA